MVAPNLGVQPSPPAKPPPSAQQDLSPTKTASGLSITEAVSEALDLLDKLEPQAPEDLPASQMETIRHDIQTVQTRAPDHALLPLIKGRYLALTGTLGEAADLLLKFVETPDGRNDWRAYRTLGFLFLDRYPQLAESNYRRAATLNPGEPSLLFGLSVTARKFGHLEEAIPLARQACEADGWENIRYITNLANLYRYSGRWAEAIEEGNRALQQARRAAEEEPESPTALTALDQQYQLLSVIVKARIDSVGHEDVKDYLNLVAYRRERLKIARRLAHLDILELLESAMDQSPSPAPPALQSQYGIALAEVGRQEKAVRIFQQILKSDPGNPVALEWLQRLRPQALSTPEPDREKP